MTEHMTWELDMPGFDRGGTVIRYGHWGRPVVVFPSGHSGFMGGEYGQMGEPEAFAATLREVLD